MCKQHRTLALATALLGLIGIGASSAQAFTITTAFGNGGDTYVENTAGSRTQALDQTDADRLRVRGDGNTRKTYLRFDLSQLDDALRNDGSASLTLFGLADSGFLPNTLNLYGINDLALGDNLGDWNEQTLTWNQSVSKAQNQAGNGMKAGVTLLQSITFSANDNATGRFEYPVGFPFVFDAQAIGDFLRLDTNDLATFVLTFTGSTGTSVTFASRENGQISGPRLTVVPTPATPALLALGLAGLVGVHRLRRPA